MIKSKILICFGTRPEWLKIKPLLSLMKREEYLLYFTGQHPDLLKGVDVDYQAEGKDLGLNRLDDVVASCLMHFPDDSRIGSVLVQGDTASAFACALSAFHRKLKIYYMEAGLRTWDLRNPYPEEAYRQMIARISDVNFAPTELSAKNLEREVVAGKTYVTGNTVLDNLRGIKCSYENTILVTMHRRENHDIIGEWFLKIDQLASEYHAYKFILPIHPNPYVQSKKHLLQHVNVVEPLKHSDLLQILATCKLVVTDSGGLQEEGAFFNKKVIVCRQTTERPEGIATGHTILCHTPNEILSLFKSLITNYEIDAPCPYGDGRASERIYDVIAGRVV